MILYKFNNRSVEVNQKKNLCCSVYQCFSSFLCDFFFIVKFFKMKFFVGILFILNIFIVKGMNISFYTEQEHEALQLCSHEYQTTLDLSYFIEHAVIPDENNHNVKCLFFCVPQKIGVTDETGVINSVQVKDMIKTKYPSLSNTAVKILLKKCGKERVNVDKCNKWYEVSKCTWKLYLEYQAKIEGKRERKTTPPRRHHESKDKTINHS